MKFQEQSSGTVLSSIKVVDIASHLLHQQEVMGLVEFFLY